MIAMSFENMREPDGWCRRLACLAQDDYRSAMQMLVDLLKDVLVVLVIAGGFVATGLFFGGLHFLFRGRWESDPESEKTMRRYNWRHRRWDTRPMTEDEEYERSEEFAERSAW